jgi:hypothetical protein
MYRDHALPAAVVGFLILCGVFVLAMRPAPPEANAVHASAVAVVELFTSDTCETCQPADELLETIGNDAHRLNRPVYVLDFHIDHQRPSNIADRFGYSAFVERQRRYASILGDRVYTPQMIVNGQYAFVGSDGFHAQRTIAEALRQQAPLQLSSTARTTGRHRIEVNVTATGRTRNAILNVAVLASPHAVGRTSGTLAQKEPHVVQAFASRPLAGSSTMDLPLPHDLAPNAATVIAYAQDATSFAVLGATRTGVE